jgi:hypothetical protein
VAQYSMEAVLEARNDASSEIAALSADLGLLSAQLDRIDGRSLNVDVNLDAGAALAELAAFNTAARGIARDIKVDVDVDTAGAVAQVATASAAMQALKIGAAAAGQGISAAMRVVPLAGGALAGMGQVAVSAGAQLAALGPAGIAVGAALAGLAVISGGVVLAALGAVLAVVGPLAAGMVIAATAGAGLAAAFALIGGPLVLLVQEIAKYKEGLEKQAQAQERVKTASDALRGAEERLGDARGQLDDATRGLLTQQRNLNAALRDEPLNQREATLDLADARDRLSDATRAYNRNVRQYGKNSEEATDALRDLRRAEIDLTRQERETTEARRRGSEELRTAREQFNRASDERRSAARGVKRAEEGVSDATRDVAKATREARTATVGLSGPALILNRAWERLKNSAPAGLMRDAKRETALLAAEVLDIASRALPRLLTTSQRSTGAMRRGFRDVREELGANERNSLTGILDAIPGMLDRGTRAAGRFGGGVVNFLHEAVPFAEDFLKSLEGSAQAFLDWTRSKEGRREIREFLASAAEVADSLGDFLKTVGGRLIQLGNEHGPTAAAGIRALGDAISYVIDAMDFMLDRFQNLLNFFHNNPAVFNFLASQLNRAVPGDPVGYLPVRRAMGGDVPMAYGGLPGTPLWRASHGLNIPSHYVEDPTLMAFGSANVLYGEALTPGHREYAFRDGGNMRFITEEPGYDANSYNLWRDLGERKGYMRQDVSQQGSPGGVGIQTRRRDQKTMARIQINLDGKPIQDYTTEVAWENLQGGFGSEEHGL